MAEGNAVVHMRCIGQPPAQYLCHSGGINDNEISRDPHTRGPCPAPKLARQAWIRASSSRSERASSVARHTSASNAMPHDGHR